MYRQDEPEVNLDQILERLRSFFGRFRGGGGNGIALAVIGIIGVALVIWLGTGFFTVQPGEQAVLRLLGQYNNTQEAGLHWYWPSPIGTRNIVKTDEIQRLEIGVRGSTSVPIESEMITGDQNLVDVQLLVQYRIKNLPDFLFKAVDPAGITIKDAAESALRQIVGSRDIDDVLTIEKEAVQIETKLKLQELLDLYGTGIYVTEVKLLNVRPPDEVQDAFDDVVRAREDKERIINLAQAYKEDILPRARGEAARLVQGAEAFSAERVEKATGEANRFLAILEEYRKAPEVTRQRLYLETMEEVLPGVKKFIVDSSSSGNLLQFLPLTDSGTAPQTPFPIPTPASGAP
ncbi:MAG: FtsH protease activity modulator HflK [Chloroflexi bacterium]|nr:FtsH protease activity modulator HflK [Chloroflexota bacterium]